MTPDSSDVNELTTNTVESPCIDICELDEQNICIGCYRSIDEIASWGSLNTTQQLQIMQQVEIRRASAEDIASVENSTSAE